MRIQFYQKIPKFKINTSSQSNIPGEKHALMSVKEQRITGMLVHLAIGSKNQFFFDFFCFKKYLYECWTGACLFAKCALKLIPVPVLFGIFLYFGIVSLSGTQLFERVKLVFVPCKHLPNLPYAKGVSTRQFYLFFNQNNLFKWFIWRCGFSNETYSLLYKLQAWQFCWCSNQSHSFRLYFRSFLCYWSSWGNIFSQNFLLPESLNK